MGEMGVLVTVSAKIVSIASVTWELVKITPSSVSDTSAFEEIVRSRCTLDIELPKQM